MKNVKCKKCECDIFTEYGDMLIENLNMPWKFSSLFKKEKKVEKYFSELNQKPSETCNTTIYLTCENNHMKKYFCKIENR